MAKFAVFLLTILCVVHLGTCLECYQCGDNNNYCTAENALSNKTKCGEHIGTDNSAVCIKEVKKGEKDNLFKKKCAIISKAYKYTCPEGHECHECTNDLCNSAPVLMSTKTALFASIASIIFYLSH